MAIARSRAVPEARSWRRSTPSTAGRSSGTVAGNRLAPCSGRPAAHGGVVGRQLGAEVHAPPCGPAGRTSARRRAGTTLATPSRRGPSRSSALTSSGWAKKRRARRSSAASCAGGTPWPVMRKKPTRRQASSMRRATSARGRRRGAEQRCDVDERQLVGHVTIVGHRLLTMVFAKHMLRNSSCEGGRHDAPGSHRRHRPPAHGRAVPGRRSPAGSGAAVPHPAACQVGRTLVRWGDRLARPAALAIDRPSQPDRDDDGMPVTKQQPAGRRRVTDAKEIRALAHPGARRPARAARPRRPDDGDPGRRGARRVAGQHVLPPAHARQVRLRRGGAGRHRAPAAVAPRAAVTSSRWTTRRRRPSPRRWACRGSSPSGPSTAARRGTPLDTSYPRAWREAAFNVDHLTYLTADELRDRRRRDPRHPRPLRPPRRRPVEAPGGRQAVAIVATGHPIAPTPAGN